MHIAEVSGQGYEVRWVGGSALDELEVDAMRVRAEQLGQPQRRAEAGEPSIGGQGVRQDSVFE
ncbi:MAG: hypothetical protein ACRDRZ_00230 [Pseudonocardiaceae bacterium]